MIIDNTIFFSSLLGLNGMPKVKKKRYNVATSIDMLYIHAFYIRMSG